MSFVQVTAGIIKISAIFNSNTDLNAGNFSYDTK